MAHRRPTSDVQLIVLLSRPSSPTPPRSSVLTERLYQAGKLLDIQVLDHIIIGDGTTAYHSFADTGTLG